LSLTVTLLPINPDRTGMAFQVVTRFLLWILNKTSKCLEVEKKRDGLSSSSEDNWLRAKQPMTKRLR